jgi:hypothetical protein
MRRCFVFPDDDLASVVGIQVTILIVMQRTRNKEERLSLSTQVSDP